MFYACLDFFLLKNNKNNIYLFITHWICCQKRKKERKKKERKTKKSKSKTAFKDIS